MKRTTFPNTKTFLFSTSSFCILLTTFRMFKSKEHSPFFRDFVISSPEFQECVSLADFKPERAVKNVEIIIHYE